MKSTMMVSLKWLRDYVDVDLPAAELADRLTMAGLEVDAISEMRPAFRGSWWPEYSLSSPIPTRTNCPSVKSQPAKQAFRSSAAPQYPRRRYSSPCPGRGGPSRWIWSSRDHESGAKSPRGCSVRKRNWGSAATIRGSWSFRRISPWARDLREVLNLSDTVLISESPPTGPTASPSSV